VRLMEIKTPAALMQRALGDDGFAQFQEERGVAQEYSLTPVQADAILKMTLGQLVNLEQEKLAHEHAELLTEMGEYLGILGDEKRIYAIIRSDAEEVARKYAEKRRTELSGEEIGEVNLEDLIEEEQMVVSISHNGYIKRTPSSVYRAQRRGGKGIRGAEADEDDPVEHLFVTSTHDYLLFFTNKGKVYWEKVYNLPQLRRESKGRAVVNLLNLAPEEKIADCRAVRDFDKPDHCLMMATRGGLVKKTELKAYSRPLKSGIIAIKLREDDELVDVAITKPGDEIILATAHGMAIRFNEADARPMGRNTSGVKGISLGKDDHLVGMVVADPDATLLTACQNGYGKRTPFGPNAEPQEGAELPPEGEPASAGGSETETPEDETSSSFRYRTQNRGGKGLRDIKTTDRNGPVVSIACVRDHDELLMITAGGKIQRIAARDVSVIGRNTQGVRIMSLDEGDKLAAVVPVPPEEATGETAPPPSETPPAEPS
jgi:DNA gyrase subunit A